MAKGKAEPDDEGLQVRIQLQVSEVASPELYADLSAVKVRSRRYRLVHLAMLGLLMERSVLQGGVGNANALVQSLPLTPAPARIQRKPSRSKGSDMPKDAATTLSVPDGFGDALTSELST